MKIKEIEHELGVNRNFYQSYKPPALCNHVEGRSWYMKGKNGALGLSPSAVRLYWERGAAVECFKSNV